MNLLSKIVKVPLLISIIIWHTCSVNANTKGKEVKLEVVLDSSIHSVPYLLVYENNFGATTLQSDRKEIVPTQKTSNSYLFKLSDQTKPMYFSLVYNKGVTVVFLLKTFHYEPGDQITMVMKMQKYHISWIFSGKNAAKYNCRYGLFKAGEIVIGSMEVPGNSKYKINDIRMYKMKAQLLFVKEFRPRIPTYSSELLQADIIGMHMMEIINSEDNALSNAIKKDDTLAVRQAQVMFDRNFKEVYGSDIPDTVLFQSRFYPDYLLQKLKYGSRLKNKKIIYNDLFKDIEQIPYFALRDKIVVLLFGQYRNAFSDEFNDLLKGALALVSNKECQEKLRQYGSVADGKKAMDFELQDVNGKLVKLTDFKGKVVFVDFWFTGCGACSSYYKNVLSTVESGYKTNDDVVFVTICVDAAKDKWLSSLKSGEYSSEQAINLYTNGLGNTHDLVKYYNIFGYPQPMIIGRYGTIVNFLGDELRNREGLIRAIENARM